MSNVAQLFPTDAPEQGGSRFNEFWEAYPHPKRKGKAMARQRFEAITSPGGAMVRSLDKNSGQYVDLHHKADPEDIIEGVKAYAKSMKQTGSGTYGYRDGGKWVMDPMRFLNSGAWEDYL